MRQITLENGLELEIDTRRLDDMALVDALAELQEGDALAVSKVSRLLMDGETRKKLYDQIREENSGRVPVAAFMASITEIFQLLGSDGKNS